MKGRDERKESINGGGRRWGERERYGREGTRDERRKKEEKRNEKGDYGRDGGRELRWKKREEKMEKKLEEWRGR